MTVVIPKLFNTLDVLEYLPYGPPDSSDDDEEPVEEWQVPQVEPPAEEEPNEDEGAVAPQLEPVKPKKRGFLGRFFRIL